MTDLGWTGAVALITIIAAAAAFVRWALPFLRRVGHFLDDWFGEDQRPGFEGRPGVPERLAAIESEQKRVRKEVEHNGGGSLKDAVKRLEEARVLDREALDTITRLVGGFVGVEQVARIEGHKAQQELFRTMQELKSPDEREGGA